MDRVRAEIDNMMEVGIITLASSAWYFRIVIDTNKDGRTRFCIGYRVSNKKMKADQISRRKLHLR